MSRSYSRLILLPTFKERFEYLKLGGEVGSDTFGSHRIFNQLFYRSAEWKRFKDSIILRDAGCDLGVADFPLAARDRVTIHHLEPITMEDIEKKSDKLLDPDNCITCSFETHLAIHYGTPDFAEQLISRNTFVERKPYDTCPWRK